MAWLDTRGNFAGKTQQLFTCTLVPGQESQLACTHTIAGLIKGVLKHLCQHCGAHRDTPSTVQLTPSRNDFLNLISTKRAIAYQKSAFFYHSLLSRL